MTSQQLTGILDARLLGFGGSLPATLPTLGDDYDVYNLSHEASAQTVSERFGFSTSIHGTGNLLVIHRQAQRVPSPTRFVFEGSNNTIIIDEDCGFQGRLNFTGSDSLVVVRGGQSVLGLEAALNDADTLIIGKGAFAWGVRIWVQGETVCVIGDGCLLSEDIDIRTTDHHSLINLDTWEQTNQPTDITIGRHVWIGAHALIGKGVIIGDGAVIAQGSVVVTSVPKAELWAGAPAQLIRRNVSWVRSHPASSSDIAELRDLLGQR